MERWSDPVREDHRVLISQARPLEAALKIEVSDQDRRVVLSWVVRTLWPELELHLRKEEKILFPALRRLIGKEASALTLLKEQNQGLRAAHRRLAELLQDYERIDWEKMKLASSSLMELLEDHDQKVNRLLIDVLEYSLDPKELRRLAGDYEEVARKAYEEEGWPGARRVTRPKAVAKVQYNKVRGLPL